MENRSTSNPPAQSSKNLRSPIRPLSLEDTLELRAASSSMSALGLQTDVSVAQQYLPPDSQSADESHGRSLRTPKGGINFFASIGAGKLASTARTSHVETLEELLAQLTSDPRPTKSVEYPDGFPLAVVPPEWSNIDMIRREAILRRAFCTQDSAGRSTYFTVDREYLTYSLLRSGSVTDSILIAERDAKAFPWLLPTLNRLRPLLGQPTVDSTGSPVSHPLGRYTPFENIPDNMHLPDHKGHFSLVQGNASLKDGHGQEQVIPQRPPASLKFFGVALANGRHYNKPLKDWFSQPAQTAVSIPDFLATFEEPLLAKMDEIDKMYRYEVYLSSLRPPILGVESILLGDPKAIWKAFKTKKQCQEYLDQEIPKLAAIAHHARVRTPTRNDDSTVQRQLDALVAEANQTPGPKGKLMQAAMVTAAWAKAGPTAIGEHLERASNNLAQGMSSSTFNNLNPQQPYLQRSSSKHNDTLGSDVSNEYFYDDSNDDDDDDDDDSEIGSSHNVFGRLLKTMRTFCNELSHFWKEVESLQTHTHTKGS